jgi:hypothetical protein
VIHFRRLYSHRGAAHAELAHWKQAAEDYSKAVVLLSDDPMDWHLHAWVRLASGDIPGYRSACASMFLRFGYSSNVDARYLAVWTYLFHAGLVPDAGVTRLAERLAAQHPDRCTSFHALGGLLFRSGQHESAIAKLQLAMAMQTHAKDEGSVEDWLFLAMAHHHLGHTSQARQWLAKACQRIDRLAPPAPAFRPGADGIRWHHRLGYELLRR